MTAEVQLLTISNILQNIRERKVWCILAAVGVVLVGILLVLFLPKKYETEALIEVDWGMGAEQSGSLLEGSFVSSLLGGMDSSNMEIHRAIASILSRDFVGRFLDEYDLLPLVFSNYWNSESEAWEEPFDEKPPTLLQGHSKFLDLLEAEVQPDTSYVLFTLRHREPDKALQLLEKFLEEGNLFLHDRALRRSEKILAEVEIALAGSQSRIIQETIVLAFTSEVQKKVLLGLDVDLPLRIIDKPLLPEKPSWPSSTLILALSVFFAAIIVLTIGLYDKPRDHEADASL